MLRLDIINSRIIQLPVSEVDLIELSTVFDILKDGLNRLGIDKIIQKFNASLYMFNKEHKAEVVDRIMHSSLFQYNYREYAYNDFLLEVYRIVELIYEMFPDDVPSFRKAIQEWDKLENENVNSENVKTKVAISLKEIVEWWFLHQNKLKYIEHMAKK